MAPFSLSLSQTEEDDYESDPYGGSQGEFGASRVIVSLSLSLHT